MDRNKEIFEGVSKDNDLSDILIFVDDYMKNNDADMYKIEIKINRQVMKDGRYLDILSFTEWFERATGYSWKEDFGGMYQYADSMLSRYEQWCKITGVEPIYDG